MKSKQLSLFPEEKDNVWVNDYVPFISEVETFNETFGKTNNYEPTIPSEKEWRFVSVSYTHLTLPTICSV